MTQINLVGLEDTFGGTESIPVSFTATPYFGDRQATRIDGEKIVFPKTVTAVFNLGAWDKVPDLASLPAGCYWHIVVKDLNSARKITRNVIVPPLGTVDFGDLVDVSPITAEPSPEALDGWNATLVAITQLVESIEPGAPGPPGDDGAPGAPGPKGDPGDAAVLAQASAAVRAALERYLSVCIQEISDSIGTDTDEFFGILGYLIQAEWPEFSLVWEQWNTATLDYDPPVTLVQGTGNGGGRRGVALTSGAMRRPYGTATTTDHELIGEVAPVGGWAPGGAAAWRTVASRWDARSAPNSTQGRICMLQVNESGILRWGYSTNGVNEFFVQSTVAVPADAVAVRGTHDVDNGAAGNTVSFFSSTDGYSWTPLGSPVVTAGTVTLWNGTVDYVAGAHLVNGVPAGFLDGTFYHIEARPGTLGTGNTRQPSVVPPSIEDWDQMTTATSVVLVGAPIIRMRAGAASGQRFQDYFDTHRFKLLQPANQMLTIVSSNANEGNTTWFAWQTSLLTWINNVKGRVAYCPIVISSQNPATDAAIGGERQRQARAARGVAAAAFAASQQGVYFADLYPAFSDLSLQIEPDGTHPTQGGTGTAEVPSGSDVMAHELQRQFGFFRDFAA